MRIFGRHIGRNKPLSCHQVGQVLQSYLDDELDEAAAAKVHAHLEDCRRCGLEAETYEALKASLQRGPAGLTGEPVARLRAFGERLARGELDADGLATP
ncbi:MAG: zf-HC2 domain-containing protein [Acidimicrobiales bacterium]|jgi:anti-sigma factor RsiW|nr:zf-HC2 domain-containing protein [Acidimicrobiales bacterium]